MMINRKTAPIFFSILFFSVSCTRVPEANEEQVAELVHDRIAKEVIWQKEAPKNTPQLDQKLDCDTAIQIALFHNPSIQMKFEELGIAQADLVQAGLFQNPIFSGYVRFPLNKSSIVNREFSISESFLEAFLMPLRKKIAATELKKVEYSIAQAILELAFDVEEAFYTLQQEYAKLELLEQLREAKFLSQTIAIRQYKAANINELMLQSKIEPALMAQLNTYKSKEAIIRLRQKLNSLMGLTQNDNCWEIERQAITLMPSIPSLETLKSLAQSQRLDLAEAQFDIERTLDMYQTKKWWAYSEPAAGISYEKDADGIKVLGPTYSLMLPLFDHGQAAKAHAYASIKHAHHALKAKKLEIANEIARTHELFSNVYEQMSILQKKIIPLEETLLTVSEKYYNIMGLSVYKFLESKERELETKITLATLFQDYIQVKVALERAVGGYIP